MRTDQVERASVPTITYVIEPTNSWLAGMRTWAEMLPDVRLFTGRYADMAADDFVKDLCDLTLCREAARELRAQGLLK